MAKSMLYTSCTSLSVHLLCRIYPIHAERSDDPLAFDDFIHHRAFRGHWHQIAGFGWLKKNGAEPPHSFASSTYKLLFQLIPFLLQAPINGISQISFWGLHT